MGTYIEGVDTDYAYSKDIIQERIYTTSCMVSQRTEKELLYTRQN